MKRSRIFCCFLLVALVQGLFAGVAPPPAFADHCGVGYEVHAYRLAVEWVGGWAFGETGCAYAMGEMDVLVKIGPPMLAAQDRCQWCVYEDAITMEDLMFTPAGVGHCFMGFVFGTVADPGGEFVEQNSAYTPRPGVCVPAIPWTFDP